MKRKFSILLVAIMLFSMLIPVTALAATSKIYAFGVRVEAAAAIKVKKVVCLQAEPVMKALQYSYSESPITPTEMQVTITKNNETISFKTGSVDLTHNGKKVKMKNAPIYSNRFTYLPSTFFTDVLKMKYTVKSGAYYLGPAVSLPDGVRFNKYDRDGVRFEYPSNWQQGKRPDGAFECLARGGNNANEGIAIYYSKTSLDANISGNTKALKEEFKQFVKSVGGPSKIKDYKGGSVNGQYVEGKIGSARYGRLYLLWRGNRAILMELSCPNAQKASFIELMDYIMLTFAID